MAQQTYYQKNREKILRTVQKYDREHLEERRKRQQKYYRNNKSHIRERKQKWGFLRREKLKDLVFTAYGGYICIQCGEERKECLTIDHINNDGAEHRKKDGRKIYKWLADNDYPLGFQVLCYNCNISKYRETQKH